MRTERAAPAIRTKGAVTPAGAEPWRVEWVEIDWVPGPVVAATLYADATPSFWLDSSREAYGAGRYSFLGDASGPCAQTLTYDVGQGVRVRSGGRETTEAGTIFEALQRRLSRCADGDDVPVPFRGGWVGYFGYELLADCGYDRGRHAAPTPDAFWMFADRFVALDHESERAYLVTVHDGDPAHARAARDWVESSRRRLAQEPTPPEAIPPEETPPESTVDRGALEGAMVRGPARYRADVERCLSLLRAGESYEICLTDNVHLPMTGADLGRYLALRQANPAPYAALLRAPGFAVHCSSPERFLTIDAGGRVESKPIKGTVRRRDDPAQDAAAAAALAADEKTRAENLMIVDLLRNDLSRVCRPGSVGVEKFLAVESYASVHQLVSTVQGQLRDDVDAVECVRTCFPPGSMTGAPKHRTLQLIDDLEEEARGVYSGALGWLGFDGAADLAVVIRTAVRAGDEATIGAGGAVVLDSDPDDELDEMLLKAATPAAGLGLGPRPAVQAAGRSASRATGIGEHLPGSAPAAGSPPEFGVRVGRAGPAPVASAPGVGSASSARGVGGV